MRREDAAEEANGGVKQSGTGREGLRYAIEEMTELKLLAVNHRGAGKGVLGE
jgi:acyl-CoA reductase-like NAD-dependent aldehyde dehydrogenase